MYIVTNAPVQEKLLRELSTAKISNPIKDAEARELPYLQAVIKEGLRIYPPVTGLFLKEVPPGGDTLNGIFVPEGACIGSAAFGVMRNPKIWGQDANLFRPERWLEADRETLQRMELNLELNFGYGKYQCLGKNIARIELNKIFVEVRFFTLRLGTSSLSHLTFLAPSTFRVYDCGSWIALDFGQLGPFPTERYVDESHQTGGDILSLIRVMSYDALREDTFFLSKGNSIT